MEYLKFFLFFQFITIYEHYTFCKKKKKIIVNLQKSLIFIFNIYVILKIILLCASDNILL